MDVHRARFVPYPTYAISALAFSRSSDSGFTGAPSALRLAIGRANGNIEIWNPLDGQWVQETVCLGDGKSVDGLAWTQDPDETDSERGVLPGQQRLFSIASSPVVTEWDLATGEPQRRSTGNFSEVWCFAAQPRWEAGKNVQGEPQAQELVAGCGDGTLVLLSTAENDLQFKRFLARVPGKRARCMCITYQSRDVVVAGFADGMLRLYDTRNGSQVRQMSLGVALPGAPKNTIVWAVVVLLNGDLVSGDSNGEVRVWDGRNYSLLQRMAGHDSDCLDLVTGADGKTIFSGSLDGKMAIYRESLADHGRKSWAKSSHRKVHSGEVKAMAAFDSKNGLSVVVSGGSDVAPTITPLRENGKEPLRSLPVTPQQEQAVSAPKARLMASWWDKDVYIWRISRRPATDAAIEPQRPRKLVAKLSLDVKQALRAVSLSTDGRLLAAATSSEIKIFQLRKRSDSDGLAVRKIATPDAFATLGARLLSFSPDGKWLAAITPDSEVHLARLSCDPEQPKRLTCLPETIELDRQHRKPAPSAFMEYDRALVRLAFAADSSVLVAGDMSGYLDSWVLEGHEDLTAAAVDKSQHDSDKASSDFDSSSSDDSDDDDEVVVFHGQHWADNPAGHLLPKLGSSPMVLTFRPTAPSPRALMNGNPGVHSTRHNPHAHSHQLPAGEHRLFVITALHDMHEIDVLAGTLSAWSRNNPTAALPEEFRRLKDRAMGAVWDVSGESERVWLYGTGWVFMLDVGQDLAEAQPETNKRKRGDEKRDVSRTQARRSNARERKRAATEGKGKGVSEQQVRVGDDAEDVEMDSEDDDESVLQGDGGGDAQAVQTVSTAKPQRKWWCTTKYRPILGI
ncbi:U3 small nucleolar RNA-associated protein, partial [Teratosphaeriaceae sp. CCFEE 6253]